MKKILASTLFLAYLAPSLLMAVSASETTSADLLSLQHAWAVANYQTREENLESSFKALNEQADALINAHPDQAEPLIWKAIILSTDAGKNGGFSALSKVKQAKALLEQAKAINPDALQGSAYTSLGSLYYQVPGWPIAFGDDDKAESLLKQALAINPQGIDPNYFYGDFLLEQDRYQEALTYFERALNAPARANRPLADKGRRDEIAQKMAKAKAELNE